MCIAKRVLWTQINGLCQQSSVLVHPAGFVKLELAKDVDRKNVNLHIAWRHAQWYRQERGAGGQTNLKGNGYVACVDELRSTCAHSTYAGGLYLPPQSIDRVSSQAKELGQL